MSFEEVVLRLSCQALKPQRYKSSMHANEDLDLGDVEAQSTGPRGALTSKGAPLASCPSEVFLSIFQIC